jgi:hypothetical protein
MFGFEFAREGRRLFRFRVPGDITTLCLIDGSVLQGAAKQNRRSDEGGRHRLWQGAMGTA